MIPAPAEAERSTNTAAGDKFSPQTLGGRRPRRPPFLLYFACASAWHQWAQIRPSPGGWGRNIFLPWLLLFYIDSFRGFQPRTLSYFLFVQKVTKNTHRGGTLSMGSLPYGPYPHDDTKGDVCPPLESPLHCRKSDVRRKRPRRGRSEANQRSVCRGRRRHSGATEACRLRQDEGCGACADAGGRRSFVDRQTIDWITKRNSVAE